MNSDRAAAIEQLCEDLIEHGFSVGRAKSGNVLRVDSRPCQISINSSLVARILRLTTLRELYLRGSAGINEFSEQIADLKKLKLLDIEASDFSDESLQRLSAMDQLELINVRDTHVTAEVVSELRKKMIGTRIIGP